MDGYPVTVAVATARAGSRRQAWDLGLAARMAARTKRVLVVGGGVVGLCCAVSLREHGHDVTVTDAAELGGGASSGNGGWICPSLSGPVPGPGVIGDALRWMLRSDSPLLIRPRFDPAFWWWLVAFARRCNSRDFSSGLEAVSEMAIASLHLFGHLQEAGVEFELHQDGLLLLFVTELAARREMEALRIMEHLGCPTPVWMGSEEVAQAQPASGGRVVAGILAPDEQHVRPESLNAGLAAWLRTAGVRLLPDTAIARIQVESGRVVGAVTAAGEYLATDHLVLSAGVGTGPLARQVGLRLPLRGGKGYSVTFGSCTPWPTVPLYLSEAKVAVSPYRDGVRVLGTMELGADPNRQSKARVQGMLKACTAYIPGLILGSPSQPWAGLRPMVPDGLPVIGAAPGVRNVVVATGHAMLGVTLAPSTGVVVANLIEGRESPQYLQAFSPSRF